MSNRLASESSPYLRQHAHNPVDWYPWGEEALTRAKAENKPIVLSIGYSACHWCHVMEKESFENPGIASLMNQHFVSIKVDREERPDLDQIYQNVAQLITRGGGWPLTVFLTPDLKPFFGGTYFPPEDRYGRPGFGRVLQAMAEAFHRDPSGVRQNAEQLTDAMKQLARDSVEGAVLLTVDDLKKVADLYLETVDWTNGGFGGAPKFPNTMELTYLWRMGIATGNERSLSAVKLALGQMARGGIYDQIGGGFHRYSVDEAWVVPHFEKMLYDNALLLRLYSEVLVGADALGIVLEDRKLYEKVVRETLEYVFREMTSPEGALYATQDADSEGEEGKFFVWTPAELSRLLTPEELRVAKLAYGVTDQGNFEHTGATVLQEAVALSEVAETLGILADEANTLLRMARAKMLAARGKRVHPGRDEKILTSWNGLMISGLAWAFKATGDRRALEGAQAAMKFVRGRVSREGGRLWSVYQTSGSRKGLAEFNAYLDDYAFMAQGALDLARFGTPEEAKDLTLQARRWLGTVMELFWDRDAGGFFFTSEDHETLVLRPKSYYDQAIPSGNAVVLECLIALRELGEWEDTEVLNHAMGAAGSLLLRSPHGMGELASAALLAQLGAVTVSGVGGGECSLHAHVFQKGEGVSSGIQICHRQTCTPFSNSSEARAEVVKAVRI